MTTETDNISQAERIDMIIEGIARWIDDIRELFTRYHDTQSMTLTDAEKLATAREFFEHHEGLYIALFLNMKHGGDKGVVVKLKEAIERFDTYFDKVCDEGYDFEKFDFLVIADQIILDELRKLTEYQKKRIPKIEDTAKWLSDNISIIDLANNDAYDYDDLVDVEKEYNFKFDNLFEDVDEIRRKSERLMRLKKMHEVAEHISLCSFFDLVRVLKTYIDRYSDPRMPTEYLKAKYQEAINSGEMIMNDEFEVHDWELAEVSDIYARLLKADEAPTKPSDIIAELQPASVTNSALFNKEFFTMTHIEHLHKVCNGRQFEEISPGDMYLILNLQHCPRRMKVREREKSRVCHLIYFLGEMLPDVHRRNWRKSLLDHLEISYSIYNKKYKEAEKGMPSRQDEIFVEKLEKLKDTYRELEKVA